MPVHRARQALAIQHRVFGQMRRHATIRVNVREIHLTTGLEQTISVAEYSALVDSEVNHTVRYDQIKRVIGQVDLIQCLDIRLDEIDVRQRITVTIHVKIEMRPCHFQLLRRHIDARYMPVRTHQSRQQVNIPAGTAPEIEHTQAIKRLGQDQSAPVIAS